MTKLILIVFIVLDVLSSKSLDEIVAIAYKNNKDLRALQNNIYIKNENQKISSTWSNPNLKLAVNDIRFDDIGARDLEPMQTQSVVLTQQIPLTNRFSIAKKISIQDTKIADKQIEVKRLQILRFVYENGYRFIIANKKLDVLISYKQSLEKLLKIKNIFLQNSSARQKDIIKTKIALSNIEIKINNLKRAKRNYLYNIENLTYQKIKTVKDDIDIYQNLDMIDIKKIIELHPYIKIAKLKEQQNRYQTELSKSKKIPDVALSLGYFQRENREDYGYVALSFALPIYGKENSKIAKSNYKLLQSKEQLESLKQLYKRDIRSLIDIANSSYKNYKTIKKTIIPLNILIQQDTTTGYQNSSDKITKTITDKIELDKSKLFLYSELEKYLTTLAKLSYYTTKAPK